jgi:hypothetical protein
VWRGSKELRGSMWMELLGVARRKSFTVADARKILQRSISEYGRRIDKGRAACWGIVVNRWLGVAAELWTLLRYAIYAGLCNVVTALCMVYARRKQFQPHPNFSITSPIFRTMNIFSITLPTSPRRVSIWSVFNGQALLKKNACSSHRFLISEALCKTSKFLSSFI